MPAGLDHHPLARAPRCPHCHGATPRRDCLACGGIGLLLGDRALPAPRPRARRRLAPREVFALVAVCTWALMGAATTGGA